MLDTPAEEYLDHLHVLVDGHRGEGRLNRGTARMVFVFDGAVAHVVDELGDVFRADALELAIRAYGVDEAAKKFLVRLAGLFGAINQQKGCKSFFELHIWTPLTVRQI